MMSTLTTTQTHQLPRVNLLPPEIAADRRFRTLQGGLGVGLLVALGAIGAIYFLAVGAESKAQEELDAATGRGTTLQKEVKEYGEVPAVFAQLAKAETQLQTAMGSEVRWSEALQDLTTRTPAGIAISRIEIKQAVGTEATVTVGGVDTGGAIIGNISWSGVALSEGKNGSRANLSDWLEALAERETYANPYFTASKYKTEPVQLVEFSSSVDVNQQALSRRYTSEKVK